MAFVHAALRQRKCYNVRDHVVQPSGCSAFPAQPHSRLLVCLVLCHRLQLLQAPCLNGVPTKTAGGVFFVTAQFASSIKDSMCRRSQTPRAPTSTVADAHAILSFLTHSPSLHMLRTPQPSQAPYGVWLHRVIPAQDVSTGKVDAVSGSGGPQSQPEVLQMLVQVVSYRVQLPPPYAVCNHDEGAKRSRPGDRGWAWRAVT